MSGICERGHGYYPGQRCPDCPTSTTGDFGAVPDSVPFGDSVTLIKRLGDRAWQFDNTEGEESTARMLREAANRLAVLERELTDSRHFGETQAGLHDFFAEECERLELRESDRQSSESRGLDGSKVAGVEACNCGGGHSMFAQGISNEGHAYTCPANPRTQAEASEWRAKYYAENQAWTYLYEENKGLRARLATSAPPEFLARLLTIVESRGFTNHTLTAGEMDTIREAADRLDSATAALPPPESGSSGSGSASALEVEAGEETLFVHTATAREIEKIARELECNIPAAIDLIIEEFVEHYPPPTSATKPEASPRPESESAEIGAAIRPRVEELHAVRETLWDHLVVTGDDGCTAEGYDQATIPLDSLLDLVIDETVALTAARQKLFSRARALDFALAVIDDYDGDHPDARLRLDYEQRVEEEETEARGQAMEP